MCSLISEKANYAARSKIYSVCFGDDSSSRKYRLETSFRKYFQRLIGDLKDLEVVFPIHPRTLKAAEDYEIMPLLDGVQPYPPQDYPSMIRLLHNAQVLITDLAACKRIFFLELNV